MNNTYMGYQPFNFNSINQNEAKLVRVNGIDGAKAYQMIPNTSVALFDGNEDVFYIKTTDGAGFPSIRAFRFEEIINSPTTNENYVSVDDFNKFKEEIYGKFNIQNTNRNKQTNSTPSERHNERRVEGEVITDNVRY